MRDFLVYIENKHTPESPYFVSKEAVSRALGPNARRSEIVIHPEQEPDLNVLRSASYFVGSGFDVRRLREHGQSLRFVHCTSAGVEKYMPLDWLPNGAFLTNSSGVHAEKGGAFGAMTVMMLCEGVPRHIRNQRLRRWDNQLSACLSSKTVVVLGFGELGSAIASRLRPFGVRIVGVSRSGRPHPDANEMVEVGDLQSVLPIADCLVVSCPLTPQTFGLIGRKQIASMKSGASLFNIARGPVVDNAALCAALEAGHLSGAALDVFDPEPLPATSPLWDVPNLMIFPHISCDDADGYVDRCLSIFAENVEHDLAGRPLRNRVDGKAGY
ncbi:D-2-hydroxyacid dehydrogenase [Rhizobium vallis]|uniref:D-2-hydroxyacid dehydrogenase n=1 Tax=Rhizobium vallis TaxID=634290 RepID=A0A3S0Y1K1_9HYPH|nr:D-2-hydroxyacid dehydrogenase [Rhizobium vallis]RUM20523.1 D-2-hydroxyacid dehydrogenase [Rhizobium vallis]